MEITDSSRDFIFAQEIAERTRFSIGSLYNQHSAGRGALAPILTKFGGRLGAWRADYDQFIASQRRLSPEVRDAA